MSYSKRLITKDFSIFAAIINYGKDYYWSNGKFNSFMLMHRHKKIQLVLALVLGLGLSAVRADTLSDAQDAYGAGEFEETITLLRPLVREENPEAAYLLGRIYEQGDGIAKDLEEAKKLYRIAAKKGHEAAQQRLDIFDAQGADESVVVEWYLPAAHDGDTEAQYNLGFMYETGWGVPVNEGEAIRWYREAAEMQHDIAQLRLGMMTIVGVGTPVNVNDGVDLIRNSAENGNRIAEAIIQDIYDVGELTQEQSSKIIAGLRRILDEGEAKTLETLRRSLRDVHKRKKSGSTKIVRTDKPASETSASNQAASVVESVSKIKTKTEEPVVAVNKSVVDSVKATKEPESVESKSKGNMFQFYSETANRGDADAQFHLGAMYIKGDQVKKDTEEGVYWIKLAAEQGHEMATTYMELWQDDISHDGLRSTAAVNWLKEAGREWDQTAIFNLGFLYEFGRGVSINFKKATQWYRFAAVEGHAEAKRRLALLKQGKSLPQEGVSSALAPGEGFAMSPLVISGILLLIVALLATMLYVRKSRSLKMPSIQREEEEVFTRANATPGMETDDRKFFDELWESKAPAPVSVPVGADKSRSASEAKREVGSEPQGIKPETKILSPELSEVEKKLAKAVDDLMKTNPDFKEPEKAEIPQVKIAAEAISLEKAESSGADSEIEKNVVPEIRKEEKTLEKQEKQSMETIKINEKIDFDEDRSVKTAKTVLGAEAFMTNGISKDALAASRISADRLFADGVAIDEAGKAVGRGSFNPHKLDADAMLSINELSFKSGSNQGVQKRKPFGAAASLLPKRSIEEEIEKEVEEIHRSGAEPTVDVSAPFTQDEERSLAEVHFNIGVMFSTGDGVPKNDTQAAKWFLKAAEEGLPEAQYNVGQCYLMGTGVAKNTALGMEWLHKAAANNFEPAIEMLKKRNHAV